MLCESTKDAMWLLENLPSSVDGSIDLSPEKKVTGEKSIALGIKTRKRSTRISENKMFSKWNQEEVSRVFNQIAAGVRNAAIGRDRVLRSRHTEKAILMMSYKIRHNRYHDIAFELRSHIDKLYKDQKGGSTAQTRPTTEGQTSTKRSLLDPIPTLDGGLRIG